MGQLSCPFWPEDLNNLEVQKVSSFPFVPDVGSLLRPNDPDLSPLTHVWHSPSVPGWGERWPKSTAGDVQQLHVQQHERPQRKSLCNSCFLLQKANNKHPSTQTSFLHHKKPCSPSFWRLMLLLLVELGDCLQVFSRVLFQIYVRDCTNPHPAMYWTEFVISTLFAADLITRWDKQDTLLVLNTNTAFLLKDMYKNSGLFWLVHPFCPAWKGEHTTSSGVLSATRLAKIHQFSQTTNQTGLCGARKRKRKQKCRNVQH